MGNEGQFPIQITGEASSLVDAAQQSSAALHGVAGAAGGEAAPALEKLGQKTEEGGRASEHAGLSHRALHLIFRQVGEASKGLEVGLMALTGVMMGSVTFGIYAVVGAIKAMVAHFERQKEVALEAAKATVQFWTDALHGNADARKAAEDYAAAMQKIIDNVDTLKQKEAEEEAVLKRVLAQRLAILEAERQAALAAAKGDKPEEARINARFGKRKSDVELDNEQAEINLKKKHLAEQSADAMGWKQAADAAARAKETGAPGREEANAGEAALPKLKEELAKLQAARMEPKKLGELKDTVAMYLAAAKQGSPTFAVDAALGFPQKAAAMLKQANEAEQAYSATQQEYEQMQADVERFKTGTAALAKAVEEATAVFNKAVEAARATSGEIGKDEAVHRVNVDAANTIKGIKAGGTIAASGVPDNALSRSVVSDIQAMEGAGRGQRMDPKQTEMVNHLVAGLRAQGANQDTINRLLLEMKDLHIDQAKKLQDIWEQLRQVQGQATRTY
jgi:hypothetical protein